MERRLTRGGIYLCDLNPIVGSEQGGLRPCLCISNDLVCIYSPTAHIVPITSKYKKDMITHYKLSKQKYTCLRKDNNIVMTEQIRTVDKMRLKDFIGVVDTKDLNAIIELTLKNFI